MKQSPSAYWKSSKDIWWCDYDGTSDIVLIDCFDVVDPWNLCNILSDVPIQLYKDRFPFRSWIRPSRIFIICDSSPCDWYPKLSSSDYQEYCKIVYDRIGGLYYDFTVSPVPVVRSLYCMK